MEPESAALRLCREGVVAEQQARVEEARTLFHEAWRHATSDADACIAALHIAQLQSDPMQGLWWYQIALARADRTDHERVREVYPSLHVNIAIAYERMNQLYAARHHYQRAAATLDAVRDPEQRAFVERGLERGVA